MVLRGAGGSSYWLPDRSAGPSSGMPGCVAPEALLNPSTRRAARPQRLQGVAPRAPSGRRRGCPSRRIAASALPAAPRQPAAMSPPLIGMRSGWVRPTGTGQRRASKVERHPRRSRFVSRAAVGTGLADADALPVPAAQRRCLKVVRGRRQREGSLSGRLHDAKNSCLISGCAIAGRPPGAAGQTIPSDVAAALLSCGSALLVVRRLRSAGLRRSRMPPVNAAMLDSSLREPGIRVRPCAFKMNAIARIPSERGCRSSLFGDNTLLRRLNWSRRASVSRVETSAVRASSEVTPAR